VSGPLLDRTDLQVRVPPVRPSALEADAPSGPHSATLRAAVDAARERQSKRGCLNADLSVEALDLHAPLENKGRDFLRRAADRLQLSARAVVRVRRLARTAADLESVDAVTPEHLAEAISFRLQE
jgi:magnesium chelatase family protein